MQNIIQDPRNIVQPYGRSTFRHMTTDVTAPVMHPPLEIPLEKTWLST
jgi:hypothetical protein